MNNTNTHSLASSTTHNDIALHIDGLAKVYDEKVAVARVHLAIPAGSFYGIVGPNGAGKTTMLSMATGLLKPDEGTSLIHGHDIWKDRQEALSLLGVLPDGFDTFDRLTGPELITYSAILHGVDKTDARHRAEELMEALTIDAEKKTIVAEYSSGMKKKVLLGCALAHNPRLLVLDEPFEAVDPLSAGTIKEILRRFCDQGGTIVLSSHVMATVEQLCDHVAVIAHGIIKAQGTLQEVSAGKSLDDRFTELVGGAQHAKELSWLAPSVQ